MKISNPRKHLSITEFEAIEIESFTVLTGLNGSGKTQLLQGMVQGSIQIEGIEKEETVYYNYNDFTVAIGNVENNPILRNRFNHWETSRKIQINNLNSIRQNPFNFSNESHENSDLVFFQTGRSTDFDFEAQFSNENDYKLLEQIPDDKNRIKIVNNYADEFTPIFFKVVRSFLEKNEVRIKDVTKEKLREEFKRVRLKTSEILRSRNAGRYEFFENRVGKDAFSINESDFEPPHFLLADIQNEEAEYYYQKTINYLNKMRSLENVSFLEDDEFINKFGKSPVEQINEVLLEYDCNGYLLDSNGSSLNFLNTTREKVITSIHLRKESLDNPIGFHGLSSGEQTLIALSLLIYKTRKNKIMPRVLLLDEIDSSLHPSMLNRLIDVIENHFVERLGFKVILATHSPTTIAMSPKDSIYLVSNLGKTEITKISQSYAIGLLSEGFATLLDEDSNLSISYNVSNSKNTVLFTEGITDRIILETAWNKLYQEPIPFTVQDCFDASFLANLFLRGDAPKEGIFSLYPEKKFIALFDFDEEGFNSWNRFQNRFEDDESNPTLGMTKVNSTGAAYVMLLPVPENAEIKKQVLKHDSETYGNKSVMPIELLFYGVAGLELYFESVAVSGGGQIIRFKGNKRKFSEMIGSLEKDCFSGLVPLFKKIKTIIG